MTVPMVIIYICLSDFVKTCLLYFCFELDIFMDGLFIEFFGWEMRRLSKLEIRFRMMSFSLFTLLDAGWKVPQAILALLDGFQELHLEW